MEASAAKLETLFQKADADMEYLSRKLDAELSHTDTPEGEEEMKVNPHKMLQKLAVIKQEYRDIVKEAEAIKEAQKEAMGFFRGEMMTLIETLTKLQDNIGMESNPPFEEGDAQALGLPVTSEMDINNPHPIIPGEPAEESSSQLSTVSVPTSVTQSLINTNNSVKLQQSISQQSAYEKRKQNGHLMEIDEEEFMSVSSLVRGRVKLTDVNQTYHILWHHFKEGNTSNALSPSDMVKMGLKVTGKTGEAKLKVLQALKLLHINSKGEVLLL